MNQPALYAQSNNLQRIHAKLFLDEFSKFIQWRKNGCDSLIDIGSGSGDVLMDYVYPLLPQNFEALVFSDISEEMVNYTKKCYSGHKRTQFEVFDIAADVVPQKLSEHFDHVTSFFSLHWVDKKLSKALKNIYQLIRPEGGDCLHLVVVSFFIFECFEILAKDSKWSNYMHDYKRFTPPLQDFPDPAAKLGQLLKEAGFVDCTLENRTLEYVFENRLHLFEFLRAVIVFFDRIPAAQQEELFEDLVNIAKKSKQCQFIENSGDYKVVATYKVVMTYARKPALDHVE